MSFKSNIRHLLPTEAFVLGVYFLCPLQLLELNYSACRLNCGLNLSQLSKIFVLVDSEVRSPVVIFSSP